MRTTKHEMMGQMTVRDALNRVLLRHLLEMMAAMIVGMVILDTAVGFALSALFNVDLIANTLLLAPVMTVNMVVGMVVWMGYRHHSFHSIWEMSAAMFIPLCVLAFPHWMGIVSADILLGGSMALMVPVMVGLMLYRRDMYAMSHHSGHEHQHEM